MNDVDSISLEELEAADRLIHFLNVADALASQFNLSDKEINKACQMYACNLEVFLEESFRKVSHDKLHTSNG
jgi:hypothetical protein